MLEGPGQPAVKSRRGTETQGPSMWKGVPAESQEEEATAKTAEPNAEGGATFTQNYLAKVQEKAQLTAAQISARGTPLSRAQDATTPRVECGTTDPSTVMPARRYAVIIVSTIQ